MHDAQCEAEYIGEAPGWTDCGCTDRARQPAVRDQTEEDETSCSLCVQSCHNACVQAQTDSTVSDHTEGK